MTVYITKVWGFSEPCGPLQFGRAGWRDRARAAIKNGDLVVLVGTKGDETAPEERGRLLGIMEPSTEPAASLDFDVRQASSHFDEKGNYKWPFALLNRRAWVLEERPLLADVSERQFNMDAAQGIVALTEDEAKSVLALRKRPVELLLAVRAAARIVGSETARRRAAPPPTTRRSGVMHMRRAPAYTYCMELVGAKATAFKIGWAFEYRRREQHFNQASMPDLGGIRYETRLKELWDTARQAFAMEQLLLDQFADQLHRSNREVIHDIKYADIEGAWTKVILTLKRH